MTTVRHEHGIHGASTSVGTTIVIDTFRAFTTAAVLLDRDIGRLVLCADVDDARRIASDLGGLLCGEAGGVMPEGFDLGNSPFEAGSAPLPESATVVQRTSSGTRSVVAAIDNGAEPVFPASLVVATATAWAASMSREVTIVSAGQGGVEPAEEDDLTASHISALLAHRTPPDSRDLVRSSQRATDLIKASWAHPEDVEIATEVDRYRFAMRAQRGADGLIEVSRVDSRLPAGD